MEKSAEAFRTISEVADLLETPAHVLRFWESRFPQIRPVKRAGGRRYYRPSDVALLTGIKRLLHDEGLTIRGVQKVLREQGIRYVADLSGRAEGTDRRRAAEDDMPSAADADLAADMPAEDGTAEDLPAEDGAPGATILPFPLDTFSADEAAAPPAKARPAEPLPLWAALDGPDAEGPAHEAARPGQRAAAEGGPAARDGAASQPPATRTEPVPAAPPAPRAPTQPVEPVPEPPRAIPPLPAEADLWLAGQLRALPADLPAARRAELARIAARLARLRDRVAQTADRPRH